MISYEEKTMKIKHLPKKETLYADTVNYIVIKKYSDGWYFFGTYLTYMQARIAAINNGGKVVSAKTVYSENFHNH